MCICKSDSWRFFCALLQQNTHTWELLFCSFTDQTKIRFGFVICNCVCGFLGVYGKERECKCVLDPYSSKHIVWEFTIEYKE